MGLTIPLVRIGLLRMRWRCTDFGTLGTLRSSQQVAASQFPGERVDKGPARCDGTKGRRPPTTPVNNMAYPSRGAKRPVDEELCPASLNGARNEGRDHYQWERKTLHTDRDRGIAMPRHHRLPKRQRTQSNMRGNLIPSGSQNGSERFPTPKS